MTTPARHHLLLPSLTALDRRRRRAEIMDRDDLDQGEHQAALRGLTKTVLRNYLERCATDAIRSGDTAVYDELMEAIYKFVK